MTTMNPKREDPTREQADRPLYDEARSASRQNLQSLQLFLLLSCAAFLVRDFNLYATFPENILQVLGCPPPPLMVQIALAGYIFTALTPLVIHLLTGEKPVAQWRHLGYRSAFYLFFLWSGTLTAHFAAVFVTGVALYLLEQFHICTTIARASESSSQPA
jgi:hypothetical protein